jgi:hypothetical protein
MSVSFRWKFMSVSPCVWVPIGARKPKTYSFIKNVRQTRPLGRTDDGDWREEREEMEREQTRYHETAPG